MRERLCLTIQARKVGEAMATRKYIVLTIPVDVETPVSRMDEIEEELRREVRQLVSEQLPEYAPREQILDATGKCVDTHADVECFIDDECDTCGFPVASCAKEHT